MKSNNETHKIKGINLQDIKFDEKKNGKLKENKNLIKNHITCLRPYHKSGLPKIYCEEKHKKYISHNYCHGGIGYSILFSTVEESIENLKKLKKNFDENKKQEITIIGLGCIGLYTALKLFNLGYENIKIIGESFQKTASQYAGGLFEYYLPNENDNNNKEKIEYLNKLFLKTFFEYKKIIEKKHEIITDGVKKINFYTNDLISNKGLFYLSEIGLIPKRKKILLEIDSNKNPKGKLEVYHYESFHIITELFMENMMRKVNEYNIPVEFRKVKSFEEIKSDIIFNCTGLGSRELNNDKDCYSICGHGVTLNNSTYKDHDFIIQLSHIPGVKENDEINGGIYFMPKTSGFIGGTYIEGYEGEDKEFNLEEVSKLLKRARFLFNGIYEKKANF